MKNIYLTALTNERYLPGCLALVKSLKEVKTKYDIAIMIPESREDILMSKLYEWGIIQAGVFILTQPDVTLPESLEIKEYYWKDTFFKLQVAACTDYDKIILLDCDQMVVKNLDHLFKKDNMTATTAGRCMHPGWVDLNSGLLVIEPSEELYDRLMKTIEPAIKWKYSEGKHVGDQDVFIMAFKEWRNKPELYIPETYNVFFGMINALCDKEHVTPDDFYMIHFPGAVKPWDKSNYHWIKMMLSYIIHRDAKRLVYRLRIWRKYRHLCNK